jgi:hypothetical protein
MGEEEGGGGVSSVEGEAQLLHLLEMNAVQPRSLQQGAVAVPTPNLLTPHTGKRRSSTTTTNNHHHHHHPHATPTNGHTPQRITFNNDIAYRNIPRK